MTLILVAPPPLRPSARFKHGGAPAPGSTTAGSVSDTKDIARNVERAEHLDDPVQRRIYEAEVTRVSPYVGHLPRTGMLAEMHCAC